MNWKYDTCVLCAGVGKLQDKKTCPVCEGYGFWEFVAEKNYEAIEALHGKNTDEKAKILCNQRIKDINPENIKEILLLWEIPGVPENEAFQALQLAGAERWGWTWVNANRFAIQVARLYGVDPTEYRYGLSRLAWQWLENEGAKKV